MLEKLTQATIVGTMKMLKQTIFYAVQTSLEKEKTTLLINLCLTCMFMIGIMIQPLKINIIQNHILLRKKIRIIKNLSLGFGSDYNYTKATLRFKEIGFVC